MEHLEGETLSKRLRHTALPFDQALEIGAQIADALAVAHRQGIVHRDLKPGNIMLTASGKGLQAKLLDFGLAKLRPTPSTDLESTHSKQDPETNPGAVLGTLPYMSPEQLEGKPTDARTDIFAFGCVLYEMLAGRRAFRGDSDASVISAIMAHEPDPLATLQPASPAALDHLIRRCLQKDPNQRSESAHDLADELRWLRQTHGASATGDSPPRRRVTDSHATNGPGAGIVPGRAPTGRRLRLLVVGLVAVAGLGYGVSAYMLEWWPWPSDPFSNAEYRRVTTAPGLQAEPAVSPDGSQIAYASDEDGTAHIRVVDPKSGATLRLTSADEPDHDPAWDSGDSAILFTRDQGAKHSIWTVPKLGGNATRVIDDAAQPAVSPDGTRLAFVREVSPSGETRIFVAPRQDPSRARPVTSGRDGLWGHSHPSWSPDGRLLCYQAQYALWVVLADGGGARRLTIDNESATDPVWSADGKWIYYTSSREGTTALWRISVKGGSPRRVTPGTGPERQPSISGDGRMLAWSAGPGNLDIVLHDTAAGAEKQFGTVLQEMMPRISPDAQAVVYVAGQTTSRTDLWVQPLGGGSPTEEARRLTAHPEGEVDHPAVSADGRWVAYYRVVGGMRDIWVVSWDGGPSRRITDHPANNIQPAWNRDGTRLAFVSDRSGSDQIWTVPISNGRADGAEAEVTHVGGRAVAPEWSPGGDSIAYVDQPTTPEADVWMIRADGSGTPHRVTTSAGAFRIRWPRQDQMVVAGTWGGHTLSLRLVDPATGRATPLVPPVVLGDDPAACDFDIDLDRRLAVFARSTTRLGNIWTLSKRQ
jgi:Tol biopolymer transport system component